MGYLASRLSSPLIAVAVLAAFPLVSVKADLPWYTGQRNYAQVSVEPAVDMASGQEIFLLTPVKAPLPVKANQRAHAPLYLVLYPTSSTINANILSCQPFNCDHVQSWEYDLKGHDHLVGVPPTGDFNVAWDVVLVSFTDAGFADGAINDRILTYDQLEAAETAGDVEEIGPIVSFNCSIVTVVNYLKGTPYSVSP